MKKSENNELKRELGLLAATSIVVGNMIGSGVFTAPQSLASVSNPFATIVAWLITGIGSVLLALSFANLGTKYPTSGGPIVYTKKAFGEFTSFLVAWTFWIGSWIGNAAIITAIIRYLTTFFPTLSSNGSLSFLISSLILWIFIYINLKGVKEAGFVGIITTGLKLVAILVFLLIALYGFDFNNLKTFSSEEVKGLGSIPSAIAVTLWSFVGLESATVSGGEIKNPKVNIRKSTIFGTIIASLIYILISFLAMGGLSQSELANSAAPMADIINKITGATWGGVFISLGIIISAAGATSGWILTTARISFAAGEDGIFPNFFAKLHPKYKTPVTSLVISGVCTNLLLILNYVFNLTTAFDFMINLATLSFIPAYALSTCAEIILTRKACEKLSPIKFIKHSLFSLLAFAYSIYIIYGSGSVSAMWVFILMLIGIPFYTYKKFQNT